MSRSHLLLATSVLLRAWLVESVPHAKFTYNHEDGYIKLKEKPELHLNVEGGAVDAGKAIVIWPEAPQKHELFEFHYDQIRSSFDNTMCLNAEGGIHNGANIVMWQCGSYEDKSVVDHEMFLIDGAGRIKLKAKGPDGAEMCLNAKGGTFQSGTELILWVCQGNENERFKIEDGMIKLTADNTLHLNIAGGKVEAGAKVVLFHTHGGVHEAFEFAAILEGPAKGNTCIRLKNEPALCLNAEEGADAGRKIVLWPCQGEKNEAFEYNAEDNTITSAYSPDLGFNAAGGAMQPGDAIMLWPLTEPGSEL